MNYPEIRFRDSFLLIDAIYDDIKPAYMPPVADADESDSLDRQTIYEKMQEYEKAWRPYENKIIQAMCDVLNLEFKQNVIDIYGAPFTHSFSSPVIIATKYTPERAIEVITHELLHELLYDNTLAPLDINKKGEEWKKLFDGVDDEIALIHIPVHAAMQAIFDDVLQEPERTRNDKEMCKYYDEYKLAWDYVERVGYRAVVNKLRA